MTRLLTVALAFIVMATNVGCASASGSEYYEAIRKTAEAQALASEAKYRALAQVAASGDGQAASAAVMAIALSQDKTVTPQYVESSALKWAQVLTPTVGTLGLGLIQAGVSKNASNNAAKVQMASMASNEAIQLGQQEMVGGLVGDLSTGWSTTAAAGGAATAEIAIAGFNALNTAGGQTVDVAVAGLNTADSIATTGMTTLGDVATAGFTQIGATAEDGINATGAVGLAGMTSLVTLGTTGIAATENTGISLGTTGMTSLVTQNDAWLDYSTTRDANIQSILADFNSTIQQLGTDLATPITCADDGTGTIVCN